MVKSKTATILFILSILISSCINSGLQESTPTISKTATQVVVIPNIAPTVTPPSSQESPGDLNRIDICPSSRNVSLENLNIPPEFRLVALSPTVDRHGDYETGYFLISPSGAKPEPIDIAQSVGAVNHNYEVSPDGQWISFLGWPRNDPTTRTLWITSLDGKTQWMVKQFTNSNTHADWISENELVIIGPHGNNKTQAFPSSYYYMPLAVINPFTLAEQLLTPLSTEYIEEQQDQMYTFRNGDVYDMFRLIDRESYVLINYGDNTSRLVFKWLKGINIEAVRVYRKGQFFIVLVKQQYGFDLSPELSLSEIEQGTEYAKIMSKIVLPKEFMSLEVSNILPQSGSLSLYQPTDMFIPIKWFTFDYKKMQLENYCLEIPWDASPYSSPDGSFIAFSRGYPEYPNGEITILNLGTGYISTIEGYQLIGWGVQQ